MSAYRNILAPIDGSPTANRGLREAIRLAKAHKAKLVLLHVVDELPALVDFDSGANAVSADDLVQALLRNGREVLKRAQALAGRAGVKPRMLLRETVGEPAADEIVRQARKLHSDLIVLGTHGRRSRRLVLGSDAERVVHAAPAPVLLVRGKE
jgi:nucleotide-binding universal stress UspA family protein